MPRTNSDAIQVDLETVLRESDVVCVHAPLDVDTKALIGSEALSRMKKGSYLINAGRGAIVDETALGRRPAVRPPRRRGTRCVRSRAAAA